MTVLLMIFFKISFAAPHPLTGSSVINKPANSLAFSQLGFEVQNVPENWTFLKEINTTDDSIEIGIENKTLISFVSKEVSPKIELESYVRQYLRDYNQYGFEITGLSSQNKKTSPIVVVDLKQKNKDFKSRQVFFHKKTKLIIATCADQFSNFNQTINLCNRILETFKWKSE